MCPNLPKQYHHSTQAWAITASFCILPPLLLQILESWDGVMALPRLTRLQLRANRITSLCQLHPLLQLPLLKQVVILDSPVCHLVLLRPYVAFRWGLGGQTAGRALKQCACWCKGCAEVYNTTH